MNELEAKYLIAAGKKPARVLRRVLQELSWAGYLAHPRGTSAIIDTYYDSADWHLRKAGWTYRLRDSDGSQRITVKQITSQRANIFDRTEVEQDLYSPLLDPERPPDGAVAEMLAATLPPRVGLRKLFSQSNHRRRYHLTHPNHPHAFIELAVDQVTVAATPPLHYAEIEFELREGPVNALQDLAGVMQQQSDLICARLGKYQRGLLAVGLQPPSSDVWRSGATDIYGKWIDVALPRLNHLRMQLKQQEPYAWEGVHIEGVHQLRVTTRRIQAGLQAFAGVLPTKRTRVLAADIRWLTNALGTVRDHDVHLERLHSYRGLLAPAQRPALNRYQLHLEKNRRSAHAKLRSALSSKRFVALDEHFDRLLEKATRRSSADWGISTQQAATEQVLPLLESVLSKGSKIKNTSPARRLHKLRIEAKRLRYQLEYLLDAYGKPARRTYQALSKLQNTLGAHQDAAIALAQLESYCHHTNLNRVERRTFNALMTKEQDDAHTYRQRFPKRWSQFEKAAWRLQKIL